MNSFSQFFVKAYNAVASVPFDVLAIITFCAFGAIFLITLFGCLFSRRIREADKKPFFHLLNIFTALVAAEFLIKYSLPQSLFAAAVFWLIGYLLYGWLCAVTTPAEGREEAVGKVVSAMAAVPPRANVFADVPAAKNSVRLEHAMSIADKLLLKNLGKGDRQELEKMKSTLTILQIKGTLTPQEGEILNESFNALLKLMAKYNL